MDFEPMLRAFLKSLGLVALGVALVAAVLDVARSIADQALVTTPLLSDWLRFSPSSLEGLRGFVTDLHPLLWDPVVTTVLAAPTWAIFALLSVLLGMAARRRKRRWQENFGA